MMAKVSGTRMKNVIPQPFSDRISMRPRSFCLCLCLRNHIHSDAASRHVRYVLGGREARLKNEPEDLLICRFCAVLWPGFLAV